jgi:Flp pilus assembly protein CpaB
MRKLNMTIIVGALIALVGAGLVLAYGRGVDNKIADGKKTVGVLVANADLPAGATAADVRAHSAVKQVPKEYVVAQPLTDLTAVAGSVLLGPAPSGTQLSARSFGSVASSATLTPSPGNVALAISVGLVPGVARYVTPGSHIDLFYTAGAGGVKVTKLFTSNVKVLSTTPSGGNANDASGDVLAIVDVTPLLAQRIVNGLATGALYFALNTENKPHAIGRAAQPNDLLSGP